MAPQSLGQVAEVVPGCRSEEVQRFNEESVRLPSVAQDKPGWVVLEARYRRPPPGSFDIAPEALRSG